MKLIDTVPPSNEYPGSSDPFGPITSIEIIVQVGYSDAFGNPTDTSTTTYYPDCGGGGLVDQLIAILIQILQTILNG